MSEQRTPTQLIEQINNILAQQPQSIISTFQPRVNALSNMLDEMKQRQAELITQKTRLVNLQSKGNLTPEQFNHFVALSQDFNNDAAIFKINCSLLLDELNNAVFFERHGRTS